MRLLELTLANFRNYEEATLDFADFNLIVGPNAQGKTNLLEAILFLATTRSHRSAADDELIREGEEVAYVAGTVEDAIARRRIEVTNVRRGRKQVRLDGKVQDRLSGLIGLLKVVFFAPESTSIVKGGPGERRRFLDLLLSQVHGEYLLALQRYHHALRQRNALLKQVREGRATRDHRDAWEPPLIEAGTVVIRYREAACRELARILERQQSYLTRGAEHAALEYVPSVPPTGEDEALREAYATRLAAVRENDLARGTTSVGPHRDDLQLRVNGADARRFASQGQQRTLTLALKLSEFDWIREKTDELPLFLLDDVTSELDEMRTGLLLEALNELPPQVFLTTTRIDAAFYRGIPTRLFEIRAGTAKWVEKPGVGAPEEETR